MILTIIEALFWLSSIAIAVYLVRHYFFTLVVLRNSKNHHNVNRSAKSEFEPTVTILIPARNEEQVIGRLLQRMTELTYPRHKTQVIVIDDASSDRTGQIAQEFVAQYSFIRVLSRDKATVVKAKLQP